MTPSITYQDLRAMPEFDAAIFAINRLEIAQAAVKSWSIIRAEHDERPSDAAMISRLTDIKAQEGKALQVAQAQVQQAFTAFLKALVKLLES